MIFFYDFPWRGFDSENQKYEIGIPVFYPGLNSHYEPYAVLFDDAEQKEVKFYTAIQDVAFPDVVHFVEAESVSISTKLRSNKFKRLLFENELVKLDVENLKLFNIDIDEKAETTIEPVIYFKDLENFIGKEEKNIPLVKGKISRDFNGSFFVEDYLGNYIGTLTECLNSIMKTYDRETNSWIEV